MWIAVALTLSLTQQDVSAQFVDRAATSVSMRAGPDGRVVWSVAWITDPADPSFGEPLVSSVSDFRDVDLDGETDLLVSFGTPDLPDGRDAFWKVRILSGADGSVLADLVQDSDGSWIPGQATRFTGDFDDDGSPDVVVGMPFGDGGPKLCVFSGKSGLLLRAWSRGSKRDGFGSSVAPLRRSGRTAVCAVAAPRGNEGAGFVDVISLADGRRLARREAPRDLREFGECLVSIGDVDEDGTDDLLVSAESASWRDRGTVLALSGTDLQTLLIYEDESGATLRENAIPLRLSATDVLGPSAFAIALDDPSGLRDRSSWIVGFSGISSAPRFTVERGRLEAFSCFTTVPQDGACHLVCRVGPTFEILSTETGRVLARCSDMDSPAKER